jgi:hypothetical protein
MLFLEGPATDFAAKWNVENSEMELKLRSTCAVASVWTVGIDSSFDNWTRPVKVQHLRTTNSSLSQPERGIDLVHCWGPRASALRICTLPVSTGWSLDPCFSQPLQSRAETKPYLYVHLHHHHRLDSPAWILTFLLRTSRQITFLSWVVNPTPTPAILEGPYFSVVFSPLADRFPL